ncbi:MAG TPA: DUF2267 domain-containing protein [Myxococcaceae bacterium]|nr:DUF2267 domain-containing protein [Myxococcaceae bacterium]
MAQGFQEEASWSGLGVGTDKQSFLHHISERLPDLDPEEAAEAVFCVLSQRLSRGTVQRLQDQLPPDVRKMFSHCERHSHRPSSGVDRNDFYLAIAEHLLVDPEDVRLIIHGVFSGLHSQITEAESRRIASELPDAIASTWLTARHAVPAPH